MQYKNTNIDNFLYYGKNSIGLLISAPRFVDQRHFTSCHTINRADFVEAYRHFNKVFLIKINYISYGLFFNSTIFLKIHSYLPVVPRDFSETEIKN